jgi:hypothetical protein
MTTKDEALSLQEATDGVERLRWAIHPFAGHPMAQRRWVQMGHMQRSGESLEDETGRVDAYVAAGAMTEAVAVQVAEVLDAFHEVKARRTDLFYEEVSAPRTFLWTTAFEEDDWTDLRAKARRTFGTLSEGKEQIIGS